MKKVIISTLIILATTAIFAQGGDQKIIYKKKTVLDFEDVMLEGQIKKPTGSFLMDRTKTKFNSLIKLKDNFNKELVKSVDLLN